jgi:hypothetical protein
MFLVSTLIPGFARFSRYGIQAIEDAVEHLFLDNS